MHSPAAGMSDHPHLQLLKPLLRAHVGKEVYVDVQGWHLFLKEITVDKDVKMHQVPTQDMK